MDAGPVNPPELFTRAPRRASPLSPTRPPIRHRIADDLLANLSPATTLEALTSPSGKLRASLEAATPDERAFGIRATLACKKIQEWVDELSTWPWPSAAGSAGFEPPAAQRGRLARDEPTPPAELRETSVAEEAYMGSLPAAEVARFESRIDDINEDMDDLDVEEIKRTVLNTHFSPKSRSSSAGSTAPVPSIFSSYARMEDFTAVVTATVLQALPNLSRLTRLLDDWTVRLLILRRIPPLLLALDDAEIALKSGWQAIEPPRPEHSRSISPEDAILERETFEVIRDVLQDKVTALGKQLDYMLDTLEGRRDTVPEVWLDRMEAIETDYGEWAVRGDRRVRAGEWAKSAKARKEEADRTKREEAAREAAQFQAERERREREARVRLQHEEISRLDRERQDAEEKLRVDQETSAEATRRAELVRNLKEDRITAEKEVACHDVDMLRYEEEKRRNLEHEEAALAEAGRRQEKARIQAEEEIARQDADRDQWDAADERSLIQEATAQRGRKQEEDGSKDEEASSREVERQQIDSVKPSTVEREEVPGFAQRTEALMNEDEKAARLRAHEPAGVSAASLWNEREAMHKSGQASSNFPNLWRQEGIQDPKETNISRGDNVPIPGSTSQQVDPDLIPAYLAIAQGDAAAITRPSLRSGNSEAAEPDSRHPHEAAHSITKSPANRILDMAISHAPDAAADPHATTFSAVGLDTFSAPLPISRFAPFDGSDGSHEGTPDPQTTSRPSTPIDQPNANFSLGKTPVPDSLSMPFSRDAPSDPSFGASLLPEAIQNPDSAARDFHSGHEFAAMIHQSSIKSGAEGTRAQFSGSHSHGQSSPSPTSVSVIGSPEMPIADLSPASSPSTLSPSSTNGAWPRLPSGLPARERSNPEWIVIKPHHGKDDEYSPRTPNEITRTSDNDTSSFGKTYRSLSLVSGYSTSDPSPEIREAKSAEYFRPILSPVKSTISSTTHLASPPKSPVPPYDDEKSEERRTSLARPELSVLVPTEAIAEDPQEALATPQSPGLRFADWSDSHTGSDGAQESVLRNSEDIDLDQTSPPVLAKRTSITRNTPNRRMSIPLRESTGTNGLTVLNRQAVGASSPSPRPCCSLSESRMIDPYPDVDDDSPSKGRARSRIDLPVDRSSSSPPPPFPAMSSRGSFHLPNAGESEVPSSPSEVPEVPEAPVFEGLDLSDVSLWSSPRKNSDDQIQAQISSLLETIPARIRLTSEPDTTLFPPPDNLRPAQTRRSLTPSLRSHSNPSLRSHSSLGLRVPTPCFTLAPAYGKGAPRPRHQHGNPEIKLYHLSRSTGEAPIKLFVRLVGENGERVMVRVGGGWADLGEYLREYASHHGRRSPANSDKVEVQEIRPMNVSHPSNASSATVRGSDRSAPLPRSGSAFDRPMSSLHIRKTRRSGGEADSSTMTIRSPSTPIPMANRGKFFETPPSEHARSSSRLSWTEEEGGLGMAGPKAKKAAISERDQEWVESMKEKVRLASAEKEKEQARNRERKSFGEIDKVGSTRRLFRKT